MLRLKHFTGRFRRGTVLSRNFASQRVLSRPPLHTFRIIRRSYAATSDIDKIPTLNFVHPNTPKQSTTATSTQQAKPKSSSKSSVQKPKQKAKKQSAKNEEKDESKKSSKKVSEPTASGSQGADAAAKSAQAKAKKKKKKAKEAKAKAKKASKSNAYTEENVWWPNREVDIDAEFPDISKPVIFKTEDGQEVQDTSELKPGQKLLLHEHPIAKVKIEVDKEAKKAKKMEEKAMKKKKLLDPHLQFPVAVSIEALKESSPKSSETTQQAAQTEGEQTTETGTESESQPAMTSDTNATQTSGSSVSDAVVATSSASETIASVITSDIEQSATEVISATNTVASASDAIASATSASDAVVAAATGASKDTTFSKLSFLNLGISEDIAEALKAAWNITVPTTIQEYTIPLVLQGHTVLCASQTGTGKTLAYVLPMLEVLYKPTQEKYYRRRGQRTRALIMVPNRELGLQVTRVIKTIIALDKRFSNFKVGIMSGGLDTPKHETQMLIGGLDILVSTPDRLTLHIQEKHLHMDDLLMVVFDEADTLVARPKISEGVDNFLKLLRKEIEEKAIKRDVQHIFVSATVSKPLHTLLKNSFPNYKPAVTEGLHRSVDTVKQKFIFAARGDFKSRLLFSTLKQHKGKRTIIFCNTTENCKYVYQKLQKTGYSVCMLHSEIDRKKRAQNFEAFDTGKVNILVATDVASRGLDLSSVQHVLLYDFPTNVIDYLHRIGRTARAGSDGYVTAFVSRSDHALATKIRDTLRAGNSLADIEPRPTRAPVRDWRTQSRSK